MRGESDRRLDDSRPSAVAFVGEVWGYALGTILDRLVDRRYYRGYEHADDEVRTPWPENGHAAAAVILIAAIIEAYARWSAIRVLERGHADTRRVDQVLAELLTPEEGEAERRAGLSAEVAEVFAVRNALMHGHVWSVLRGRWQTDLAMGREPVIVADQRLGLEDPRAGGADRTPRLGLNLIPTWVDRDDVRKSLDLAVEVLSLLEAAGYPILPVYVPMAGRLQDLRKAATEFAAATA